MKRDMFGKSTSTRNNSVDGLPRFWPEVCCTAQQTPASRACRQSVGRPIDRREGLPPSSIHLLKTNLMAAQREAGLMSRGTAGTGNANLTGGSEKDPPARDVITFAEAGIDKHLADRARKLAAIPETEFDGIVTEQSFAALHR
jgi:hypothetical protein